MCSEVAESGRRQPGNLGTIYIVSTALLTASTPNCALRAVQAVLAAGLVCGTLDGISALIVSRVAWRIVFQFIASGVLGPTLSKVG